MADDPTPDPTLPAPDTSALTGPAPPDATTVQRMHADHQRNLALFDDQDPSSPVFGRPDLAEQYRTRAQHDFETILTKAGIVPPQPETPAQRAEREFAEQWQFAEAPFSEAMQADMDAEIAREDALSPSDRRFRVAELQREYGAEYDAMVAQAKAVIEDGKWSESMASNRFVLQNLAEYGRYAAAHARARAAMKR